MGLAYFVRVMKHRDHAFLSTIRLSSLANFRDKLLLIDFVVKLHAVIWRCGYQRLLDSLRGS